MRNATTRADFWKLADARRNEAETLFNAASPGGAYYLSGVAIELALKACIILRLQQRDEFPPRELLKHCYIHDIEDLAESAGLLPDLRLATLHDTALDANWSTVKDWDIDRRYSFVEPDEAGSLLKAAFDADNGIYAWIQTFYNRKTTSSPGPDESSD